MRKLAWTALGFALGAGLAEYLLPTWGLPYFAAALAAGAVFALLWKKKRRWRTAVCLMAAGLGVLAWWVHYARHVAPCEALADQTVTIEARVTDYVEVNDGYERVEVRILSGAPRERALLYLYDGQLPPLEPGDTVQAEIRVTSATVRRGERSRLYTAQNQNLLGYIQGEVTVGEPAGHPWVWLPQRLCHGIQALCDELFDPDTAPFIKALLTGDARDLRADTANYTAMRMAGVLHVVAVSGMHMFVLVGFLQILLGKNRRTSLLCVPMIALFALMAGAKPSVVRAAVMQILYLSAPLLKRESDGFTCLGAALLLLLGINPMAVAGQGLQLSFACMAGLVLLLPGMLGWMRAHLPMRNKVVEFTANNLACTVGATFFSMPLAALYFGEVPLLSLVANLLTLLIVEICFAVGYIVCAMGTVLPGVAKVFGWVIGLLVKWCMLVYRTVAAIPVATLTVTGGRAVVWLGLLYALIGLWYILRRKGRRLRLSIPVSLALIGLCLVLAAAKLSIREGQGRLAVLDVNQGQCVVLADSGAAVVIDCGGSGQDNAGDVAADYLLSVGKTRVDLLILTHLHADHTNGVETLLCRMPVDRLILPASADDGDDMRYEILEAAEAGGTEVLLLEEESLLRLGTMELALLLPQADGGLNERGIVVLADMLGTRSLIMGDAGNEAEMSLLGSGAVPDVDVLVAGHHGSKTASGALFLKAAQPETAVVSVGWNSYGQPAEETLERLGTYCPEILRTDREGTVTIRIQAEGDYG